MDEFYAAYPCLAALLSNNGIVNALFGLFGFGPVKMLNTPTAVVFGMVYDFLPFMILPIYNSIARIKPDVIEAAKTWVQIQGSY